MSVPSVGKKAAEALAKAAPTLSKYAIKTPVHMQTLKEGEPMKVLRPPRAVTVEESATILPARESNKTSMMPWKGWFQTFLKENVFTPAQFEKFRNTFFFMPDDVYDLQQSPKLSQKIPISNDDPTLTHMYRTPSPGSQGPARQPYVWEGKDPFDSGYYKRDTRRRYLSSELGNPNLEKERLLLMDPDDPTVAEAMAKIEAGPESSKGNNGRFATGPTDFDPTGLRASMSANWKELEKSLDSHMPDHLPTPVWMKDKDKIIAWYQERDLPLPVGGYYAPMKVPRERRIAYW